MYMYIYVYDKQVCKSTSVHIHTCMRLALTYFCLFSLSSHGINIELSAFNYQLMNYVSLLNKKINWIRTSNCKVVNKSSVFRIQVLFRIQPTDKTGQRRYNDAYNTIYDA